MDFRINKSQIIEAPAKIEKWDDVSKVIEKSGSLETESIVSKISKEECFGFILGMMVGDAGKRADRRDGLDIQLTTRSETNLTLGNFFCECLKKLVLELIELRILDGFIGGCHKFHHSLIGCIE